MADDSPKSRYNQARRQFDDLAPDEQAQFLIEATASTLAHGIERVGKVLARGLQDTVRRAQKQSASGSATGPGAAEPETAQRRRPRDGSARPTDDDA